MISTQSRVSDSNFLPYQQGFKFTKWNMPASNYMKRKGGQSKTRPYIIQQMMVYIGCNRVK